MMRVNQVIYVFAVTVGMQEDFSVRLWCWPVCNIQQSWGCECQWDINILIPCGEKQNTICLPEPRGCLACHFMSVSVTVCSVTVHVDN